MKNAILILALISLPLSVWADFTRDLYFGMRKNPDVIKLQEFLRSQGHFTYPQSTGNYFQITLDAVKKFQKAQGLSPVGGYFGPQSRAAANRLLKEMPSPASPAPATALNKTSPYKDKIKISYVSGTSDNPQYESATLDNRSDKEKISITGFMVENSRGERFVIPKGYELPGFSASAQDLIFLRPGERATITVGKQNGQTDFRPNLCTGYFDEQNQYTPSLSRQCPRKDTKNLLNLSDRCLRIIDSTSYCRQASSREFLDSDCSQYVNEHLTYAGCVRDYRARQDFYSNEWLVWMQRSQEFFRNVREKIILRDQTGAVVDEYSY